MSVCGGGGLNALAHSPAAGHAPAPAGRPFSAAHAARTRTRPAPCARGAVGGGRRAKPGACQRRRRPQLLTVRLSPPPLPPDLTRPPARTTAAVSSVRERARGASQEPRSRTHPLTSPSHPPPDSSPPRDARRSRSRTPPRRDDDRSRSRSAPAGGDGDGAGAGTEWRRRLDSLESLGHVRPGEVDDATIAALAALEPASAELAVARFAESNFARITNKSGFLMGIIRRVKDEGPGGGGASSGATGAAALATLTGDFDRVARKLQDMINEGRLADGDVDRRMCKALLDLGPTQADEAVDKFSQANLESVRSKAGFMMGIIRRLGVRWLAWCGDRVFFLLRRVFFLRFFMFAHSPFLLPPTRTTAPAARAVAAATATAAATAAGAATAAATAATAAATAAVATAAAAATAAAPRPTAGGVAATEGTVARLPMVAAAAATATKVGG